MRNLLQLIVRYSNFLLLVGLEVVAFILVVHGNKYQQVALSGAANAVTASVHLMTDNVTSYFRLRSDNAQLLEENARLNAEIMQLYNDQTRQRHGNGYWARRCLKRKMASMYRPIWPTLLSLHVSLLIAMTDITTISP